MPYSNNRRKRKRDEDRRNKGAKRLTPDSNAELNAEEVKPDLRVNETTKLYADVFGVIAPFLEKKDIARLAQTSTDLNDFVKHLPYWKLRYQLEDLNRSLKLCKEINRSPEYLSVCFVQLFAFFIFNEVISGYLSGSSTFQTIKTYLDILGVSDVMIDMLRSTSSIAFGAALSGAGACTGAYDNGEVVINSRNIKVRTIAAGVGAAIGASVGAGYFKECVLSLAAGLFTNRAKMKAIKGKIDSMQNKLSAIRYP